MNSKTKITTSKASEAVEREKRLAEALRKNLRRRKSQNRPDKSDTDGTDSQ